MEGDLSIIMDKMVLGKEIKIYGTAEEPYFLAKEVAEWIDHKQPSRLVGLVDRNEKGVFKKHTLGGTQEMWFLTEDGLYEVLMQSRKPVAKLFRKEVKAILKEIRRKGIYVKSNKLDEMLENPELTIEMLKKIKASKDEVKILNSLIVDQKPKVIFADAVTEINSTILIGELAKLIKQNGVEIGQNRLFNWLRENGYLIKKKGSDHNMPTQKSMDLKLFKVKVGIINKKGGKKEISKTTKVTGKGQIYFINKFCRKAKV